MSLNLNIKNQTPNFQKYQPFEDEQDIENQGVNTSYTANQLKNSYHLRELSILKEENPFLLEQPHKIDILNFLVFEQKLTFHQSIFLIVMNKLQSKEQALSALTQDQEYLFNHYFLPKQEQITILNEEQIENQVCVYCNNNLKAHNQKLQNNQIQQIFQELQQQSDVSQYGIDLNTGYYQIKQTNKLFQQLQGNDQENQNINLQQSQQYDCQICYETLKFSQQLYFNEKYHSICTPCFSQYLSSQIIVAQVLDLKCCHCEDIIDNNTIKQYCSQQEYEKYLIFLQNAQIKKDKTKRICTNPVCQKIIELDISDVLTCKCLSCDNIMCLKCNRTNHEGKNCEEAIQLDMQGFIKSNDYKLCPNCKIIVEKTFGCNVMKCKYCQQSWCWGCGQKWTQDHTNINNPNACPLIQEERRFRQNHPFLYKLKNCCIIIFVVILISIIIPFLIIFSGPIMVFSFINSNVNYRDKFKRIYQQNKITFIFLVVFGFIVSLLLSPLIVSGVILCCPCISIGIGFGIYQLNQMQRRQREAPQEIEIREINIEQAQQE